MGILPNRIKLAIKKDIPDLFEGKYKSVLYIGANQKRQHFLDEFVESYESVTVLEIFPSNVEFLKEKFTRERERERERVSIIHGDVHNAITLGLGLFDVVFFWHGPEHIEEENIDTVLSNLEGMTKKLIVLGMPQGKYEQGAEYGNQSERHLWYIYPEDLKKRKYDVGTVGRADQGLLPLEKRSEDTISNMHAWKYITQ